MPFELGCRPISGFPLFASSSEGGCTPPTLHDLERLPNGQGLGPQPVTIWSGSCKRHQHDSERFSNGQGLDPPNPSRFGAVPKLTRVGPPQPFTTWRVFLSRKLTADFLLPKSAEKNVPFALGCRPISSLRKPTISSDTPPYRKSNENPPAQPLRKPKPERDRLTESTHTLLFVSSKIPPAQPHRKPTASSGTRQHSLTDSPLLLPAPARTA